MGSSFSFRGHLSLIMQLTVRGATLLSKVTEEPSTIMIPVTAREPVCFHVYGRIGFRLLGGVR